MENAEFAVKDLPLGRTLGLIDMKERTMLIIFLKNTVTRINS